MTNRKLTLMFFLLTSASLVGCNIQRSGPSAPVQPPTLPPAADTPTATAQLFTDTPQVTSTPSAPVVLRATLCWQGPGPQYIVVSGLPQGQTVKLLGKGSIPGWFIVENPTYHDPCWVQASDLQVDPAIDQLTLKVFSPPPLKPTKTPKPKPTNTP